MASHTNNIGMESASQKKRRSGHINVRSGEILGSPFLYLSIIALLCLIVYSNTFHVPFIFDDIPSIKDNRVIFDIGNFLFNSTGYDYHRGRFIGYLTFALNYRLGGLDVTGYHIVNLAIHMACALLVYGLVALTFRTPTMKGSLLAPQTKLIAFFSAALFAVHPIQTEAVTYIVQRLASLAALFYVASLYFYIRFRLDQGSADGIRWQGYMQYVLSVASAVLAMKTKEISFTLPFIVVLYELVFFGSGNLIKRTLWALPLLATVVIIPLTMLKMTSIVSQPLGKVLSDVSRVTVVQTGMTRWEYLMTEFPVIMTYIRLLFFPAGQNLDYAYPLYRSFFYPQVMLSFLFLTALFGLGIYMAIGGGQRAKGREQESEAEKVGSCEVEQPHLETFSPSQVLNLSSSGGSPERRLMGFGILWFFITLSVESSIIPIADVIFEHRVYLPSIGMIICVVTGAFLLKEKVRSPRAGRIIIVMLSLAVVLLSVAAYLRNNLWGDSLRLWEDVVAKSPAKSRSHYNMGSIYISRNMFDKAREQCMLAVKLEPDWPEAHNNLGNVYKALNMPDQAMKQYLTAIKLSPDYPDAYYNLGVLYDQALNMPYKAIEQFLIAIKLRRDYLEAHNNLGVVYQALNMPYKALEQFLIAIKYKPDYTEAYYNLGNVYKSLNMPDKAMEQYLLAVKFRPDYMEAHNNLAIIYQDLNMPDKAVNELQTVLRIDPNVGTAHFNLGVLYYRMGQKENARRELIARLKIKPDDQIARKLLDAVSH